MEIFCRLTSLTKNFRVIKNFLISKYNILYINSFYFYKFHIISIYTKL